MQLGSVRQRQRHNPLAYMMYINSILSLQCIIGRFSNTAGFGCFVFGGRLCCRVLAHISRDKSKTGPDKLFFSFNVVCKWFVDRFHEKIEAIGRIRWEWKLHVYAPTRAPWTKPGRLYVGRWNERVRAKRCDAVDWGLLKQGDSTYLHSNLDFERNYTKLPSMWIRNFFTAFLFCGNGKR